MDATRAYVLDVLIEPRCRRSRDARRGAQDHDGRAGCRRTAAAQPDGLAVAPAGHERKLAEQRKVQAELHRPRVARRDGARIALELRRVARHFRVGKRAQAPAFVLAGLEVDDPATPVGHERSIEPNVLENGAGAQRQLELRARFRMRTQHPAPVRVGQRARQRRDDTRYRTLAFRGFDAEQLELAGERRLRCSHARGIPALEPLLRDALQVTVHDRADVRRGLARPNELRARRRGRALRGAMEGARQRAAQPPQDGHDRVLLRGRCRRARGPRAAWPRRRAKDARAASSRAALSVSGGSCQTTCRRSRARVVAT